MQPITVQYFSTDGARLFAKIYDPAQIRTLDIARNRQTFVAVEEVTEDYAYEYICNSLIDWGLMEITSEVDEFDFNDLVELYSVFAKKLAVEAELTREDYYRELGRLLCRKKFYEQELFVPAED